MRLLFLIAIAFAMTSFAAVTGCGSSSAEVSAQVEYFRSQGQKYLLPHEPDGAIGVVAARESAKAGESIVVIGRISGTCNPWVKGRAAFTLLDTSIELVPKGSETAPGTLCTGDCCAGERARSMTLVKFLDENGQLVKIDARQLLGVAANDLVVVSGKANTDKRGNLVVLANGVYVKR